MIVIKRGDIKDRFIEFNFGDNFESFKGFPAFIEVYKGTDILGVYR
jgi:hypothetical protein